MRPEGGDDPSKKWRMVCCRLVGAAYAAGEFCFGSLSDDTEVTRETLLKLGKGKAYTRRREFEGTLRSIASQTQPRIVQIIKQHDPNQESPMFEGGFWGLVAWYRNITGTS